MMEASVAMVTKLALTAILGAAPPPWIDCYDRKSDSVHVIFIRHV